MKVLPPRNRALRAEIAGGAPGGRRAFGPTGQAALGIWLLSRLALVVLVAGTGWFAGVFAQGGRPASRFLERWTQWDVALLIEIARYGYGGDPTEAPDPGLPAFFPGMPLALRAVHLVVPDWRVAALLTSFLAGAVAVVALARLAERDGPPGAGPYAVAALVLSPWAVFLFAGYTEALFLAFALPAWLLARDDRWAGAALLAAGAATVRITGVFLAVALAVQFLVSMHRRRGEEGAPGWARAPWLVVPFVPPVLYSAYLYTRNGDVLGWLSAQEAGWGRRLVPPWESLRTTWNAAFGISNQFTWPFRTELLAAAVGVALVVWLLVARRWGELAYTGLQVAALMSSTFYLSVPRATLLWWPLWLLVAGVAVRHRWAGAAYVAVCVPLMVTMTIAFTRGAWVA